MLLVGRDLRLVAGEFGRSAARVMFVEVADESVHRLREAREKKVRARVARLQEQAERITAAISAAEAQLERLGQAHEAVTDRAQDQGELHVAEAETGADQEESEAAACQEEGAEQC
ncbi:hypothetical protein [Streptomyces monashensis]|uniref:hypothetical protein n=1 Tax=Streptomyces monashensis TaxID=1678012 RepID=UPI0015A628FF|nr:hypothetical protein [Streptomyces monashensis]